MPSHLPLARKDARWLDVTGALDSWSAPPDGRITLFPFRRRVRRSGYAAVRTSTTSGQVLDVVYVVVEEEGITTLRGGEAHVQLRRGHRPGRRRHPRRSWGPGLALVALGLTAGCASATSAPGEDTVTRSPTADAAVDTGTVAPGQAPDPGAAVPEQRICPPMEPPYVGVGGPEPDGSPTQIEPEEYIEYEWYVEYQWSDGENVIIQRTAEDLGNDDEFSDMPLEDGQTQDVRIVPVGDWGLGQVQLRTQADGCDYITWLGAGVSQVEAEEFARDW